MFQLFTVLRILIKAVEPILLWSGGGSSGTVRFAPYLEYMHGAFMQNTSQWGFGTEKSTYTSNIVKDAGDTILANPYNDVTIPDPDPTLDDNDTQWEAVQTFVQGLDSETDWETFTGKAATVLKQEGILHDLDIDSIFGDPIESSKLSVVEAVKAASLAINDVVVRGAVRAFERRNDSVRRAATNRFSGQMSDINAVQSSAYMFGMAIIESQHIQNVAEFDAGLTADLFKTAMTQAAQAYRSDVAARLQAAIAEKSIHDQMLTQSINLMTQANFTEGDMIHALSALKTEINRLRIVASQEHSVISTDIGVQETSWTLDTYLKVGQFLGTLGGGTAIPNRPSTLSSSLGGALSGAAGGAATGAKIGAAGGPITAKGGALLGGLLGLGAGLLN